MSVFHYILLAGFCFLLISGILMIYKMIRAGYPRDFSHPIGNVGPAIFYSFTSGMSPLKKESAYLHLPTYIAGMFYHIGTFFAFFLLIIIFFNIPLSSWLVNVSFVLLILTSLCGFSILLKRIFKTKLRNLSNPDDYVSNLIVTLFQLLTAVSLLQNSLLPYLFIWTTILFLIIPISKLRHLIYFFASRIQLGMFYGWRGIWPLKKRGSDSV